MVANTAHLQRPAVVERAREALGGGARAVFTDKVLAVQIVGAEASGLIATAGLAVEMAATTEDWALTVHAHPTMAEAMLEAAHAAMGHPLHALK